MTNKTIKKSGNSFLENFWKFHFSATENLNHKNAQINLHGLSVQNHTTPHPQKNYSTSLFSMYTISVDRWTLVKIAIPVWEPSSTSWCTVSDSGMSSHVGIVMNTSSCNGRTSSPATLPTLWNKTNTGPLTESRTMWIQWCTTEDITSPEITNLLFLTGKY